jgi:TonB family protein
MKTKILLFVIICLPIFVWGQKNSSVRDTLGNVDVTPPEFTGIVNVNNLLNSNSIDDLGNYLSENIQYPEDAARCYKQGTVVVEFVVTANGELTDFNVINSVCPIIDQEFIRVLETTSGMWKPGYNNGRPVPMETETSMMFVASEQNKTNPKAYFTKIATTHFTKANTFFLEKHKLKKALRNYDQTINYLPYDGSTLLMRGLCRYGAGDMDGACSDWERINRIGSFDASNLIDEMTSLKGYDEMMAIIEK